MTTNSLSADRPKIKKGKTFAPKNATIPEGESGSSSVSSHGISTISKSPNSIYLEEHKYLNKSSSGYEGPGEEYICSENSENLPEHYVLNKKSNAKVKEWKTKKRIEDFHKIIG